VNTHVEFRSARFPPCEGEEDEINPGRWGKRLAEFLVAGLSSHGYKVEKPAAEDWGWIVWIENDSFPMWIGCGNYEEYPDGFLCFIEPHKKTIWRWFRRIDTTAAVTALQTAIHSLLSAEPSIHDIRWWTHEEFNRPTH
jgi:hypothetical protein